MQTVISIQNLNVRFGTHSVLSDINLDIFKNEITVILGGSGSGKTTLLKHIIGLIPDHDGDIQVMGKKWKSLEAEAQKKLYLKMGVFYQNGALINSMTVGDNVALPLQQHSNLSDDIIDRLVRLKLNLVNIEHAIGLYPSQLSGGMLKRAALARAIAMDPQILFCDEPGAGLDPVSLAALDELILKMKTQLGITIVLVTHEVTSIKRLADRVIFLEEGNIRFHGSLKEALSSKLPGVERFFKEDIP